MLESPLKIVRDGDYVIIQKQNYRKLCKVGENASVTLGKEEIEVRSIIGEPYWTTFKMVQKSAKNPSAGKRKLLELEVARRVETAQSLKKNLPSGADNRKINDDGASAQRLTKEEIEVLREAGKSSNEILGQLIENSKSFAAKTEYSQEKYLKKKERKYFRYLSVRPPDVRSLQDIYYRQDHGRINCLRIDTLAQILSYCDVKAQGIYMLYDSGSMGLPAAALLARIGARTEGSLVQLHPGNQPQTTLVQAMNFPSEQLARLASANLYSFLRLFYRSLRSCAESKKIEAKESEEQKAEEKASQGLENSGPKRKALDEQCEVPAKRSKWLEDTEKALAPFRAGEKLEGLVVVAKEHPLNIVRALLPFLGASRPFVIYHCYREPLQETYVALKQRRDVVNLRLVNNFFRGYQVLPNRTHPEILTSDLGGYLLTGYFVHSS